MKYVKIKSKTYNEAMMKLRMDYGDDAIPVSHRYIKEGGLLNSKFFATNLVELTAAIPEKKSIVKDKPLRKSSVDFTVGENDLIKNSFDSIITAKSQPKEKSDTISKGIDSLGLNALSVSNSKDRVTGDSFFEKTLSEENAPLISGKKEDFTEGKKFEKEFQDIKDTLKALLDSQIMKTEKESLNIIEDDEIIEPYINILKSNDFDLDERNSIIKEVRRSMSQEDLRDRYKIEKTLKELLKNKVATSGPIKKGMKKKIVMFIGPTGVGKTTTMAKLGAIYALRENHSVAFITIDTYRIAATEQLKKYAGIMKIPIHVVNDQNTFKDVINKEKADIIMVDTSGRSHKNDLKLSEIKSYADMVEYDFEKVLCVSANTKKGDLAEVFKAFGKINFNSVIITKVDEASYIGSVVNVADKYKKPISYCTNGQEVPNDIFIAEPDKIIDMIVGGVSVPLGV